jgi:glycine/D-amino acid oxidase-like deaminating enzyme
MSLRTSAKRSRPPKRSSSQHFAIVGAGIAGVACARTLVQAGHRVTVFEWNAQPATADHARVATMLQDDLTADEAVAIAMVNSPRLQVTLAELGIARADLIDASTISNPVFEAELRFPAAPYHPFELSIAQSLIDLIQLPRRRALGRATRRSRACIRRFGRRAALTLVGRQPTARGITLPTGPGCLVV